MLFGDRLKAIQSNHIFDACLHNAGKELVVPFLVTSLRPLGRAPVEAIKEDLNTQTLARSRMELPGSSLYGASVVAFDLSWLEKKRYTCLLEGLYVKPLWVELNHVDLYRLSHDLVNRDTGLTVAFLFGENNTSNLRSAACVCLGNTPKHLLAQEWHAVLNRCRKVEPVR